MARASAEDLRPVLADLDVATLLIYGDRDVRAHHDPVADHLHVCASGSTLVTLGDVGHVCNLGAPHELNRTLRVLLVQHS